MKVAIVAVVALGLCVAAACSPRPERSGLPGGAALPPPDPAAEPLAEPLAAEPLAPPAGEATAPASAESLESAGPVVETISPDPASSGGGAAIAIPDDSGWTNPDIPLTQRQIDIAACYESAAAQIAREAQIDSDRYEARNYRGDLVGLTSLSQRLDYYSENRRRGALFDSCMQAKGYVKN